MSRLRLLAFLPLAASLAVACSSTPEIGSENTGSTSSAIINGQLDTKHQAVVALILEQGQQGGICSGTIVKVDAQRKIGWVATAAHCVDVPPKYIIAGPDFLSPSALVYKVLDYEADPRYGNQAGTPYDFAMVRIAGVDGSTPVIPFTSSPDGLSSGTPVTSVGYGRTSLIEPTKPEDQNTKRWFVNKSLSQVGSTEIGYGMSQSGICQGDSGGPVLVNSGGSEKVVGIHSYVSGGGCNGFGVSGRVTAGASFWNQQLAKALPPDNCQTCDAAANSGTQECAQLNKACLDDPECKAFSECLGKKKKADCLVDHPKAEGPFMAAANCVCTRACASQCGSSDSCKAAPKCGYAFPAGECRTCTEGSCCQEAIDCAADGTCYLCLKKGDDVDPECATNAKRKALATCSASKCKDPCAGDPITNNADPEPEGEGEGGGEGGGTTTTKKTTSGCAASGAESPNGAFAFVALGLAISALRRRRR